MRTYTSFASVDIQRLLGVLVETKSSPTAYRDAMTSLGRQLAHEILAKLMKISEAPVCVACTAEDADFLVKGLLEELELGGYDGSKLKLVCFWNERVLR